MSKENDLRVQARNNDMEIVVGKNVSDIQPRQKDGRCIQEIENFAQVICNRTKKNI